MQLDLLNGDATLGFINNPTALAVVVLVLVLLFGSKNIPELMKGLGQGMREFKKGMDSDSPASDHAKEQEEARLRAEIEQEVRARILAERRLELTKQDDKTLS